MSLVAYGSSDESENEEEFHEVPFSTAIEEYAKLDLLSLEKRFPLVINRNAADDTNAPILTFDPLPDQKELDNESLANAVAFYPYPMDPMDPMDPLPKKIDYDKIEKRPKRKIPVKIFAPALFNFDDDDDDNGDDDKGESSRQKRTSSEKPSGLVGILPKPNNSRVAATTKPMIPHVLTKKPVETKNTTQPLKSLAKPLTVTKTKPQASTLKSLSSYNSDSEDDDFKGTSSGMDFFSLSTPSKIPDEQLQPLSNTELYAIAGTSSTSESRDNVKNQMEKDNEPNKILVNNVINLPKEEILLKNKAEVGPKLPVPEQEYHIDSEGNVAFDDKAIEYLCGKRGVKRKNELNNVDIIEINGEDIKPDEREWMVKALTEEAPTRPISIGTGPGGQSKKKHQITYLAHQAKAMEIELKNQWAQNKASRQQTRSKYGF